MAQTPYPDLTLQDVTWTDGTHHHGVTQRIVSPFAADRPVSISGTADAEFVSGAQVRLRPGFHAGGFAGGGRFRARIDETLGPVGDVIIISPAPDGSEPYGSIVDNVIHVHKWEKVEVGLRLPQEYADAIDRFFQHYYPYNHPPHPPGNPNTNVAVPGNVDPAHDLNPYADDSLQLVMTLTKPDGTQTMKWGFFMREAKWASSNPLARLAEDPENPLHPYHVRFRFAPDQTGAWQFRISVNAPFTSTLDNAPLPDLLYTGYALACEPPLPDNKGPLSVNPNNHRTLWFAESQEPFFAMGVNTADTRHGDLGLAIPPPGHWYTFYQRDHEVMLQTMTQLHEVGGNFLRMYLMRHLFASEWVNTGVYDLYYAPRPCADGGGIDYAGSCQWQAWAFDAMLSRAREQRIYVQLCIDPYPPIIDYESFIWGNHPYHLRFVEPERNPTTGLLDLKRFFFTPGVPLDVPQNVFYWWKRKYKYILSRWGWSVNLPIIEPFNEIDQLLGYRYEDMRPPRNSALCPENRIEWIANPGLPSTVSDWFTHIAQFVRGAQDANDPAHSPLGEDSKLFLVSYAGGSHSDIEYHAPFLNDEVDLIDAHRAPQNPWDLRAYGAEAEQYRNNFTTTDGRKKPFNQGEWTTYGDYRYPESPPHIFEYGGSYRLFDNYDVSFHNELWAGAFSGKFATGTTWGWERVFWWPDALPVPPGDTDNPFPLSNGLGVTNQLRLYDSSGQPFYVPVQNRTLHHHFKPLSDFLSKPSVQALGLFTEHFTPRIVEADGIECFYLINDAQDIAVGWVHNANAYWRKAAYITSQYQHYLECADPAAQSIDIDGFLPGTELFISFFPTRIGMTEVPDDAEEEADADGRITLSMAPAFLNGTFPATGPHVNHLDTLHSDYAFVVAPWLVKRLTHVAEADTVPPITSWDFQLYPNPARGEFFLRFQDDGPRSVTIFDLAGRTVRSWSNLAGSLKHIATDGLARGAYWVRATDGMRSATKKLLVH
jgi:hypothetical protein